jgi:hypothetical protein
VALAPTVMPSEYAARRCVPLHRAIPDQVAGRDRAGRRVGRDGRHRILVPGVPAAVQPHSPAQGITPELVQHPAAQRLLNRITGVHLAPVPPHDLARHLPAQQGCELLIGLPAPLFEHGDHRPAQFPSTTVRKKGPVAYHASATTTSKKRGRSPRRSRRSARVEVRRRWSIFATYRAEMAAAPVSASEDESAAGMRIGSDASTAAPYQLKPPHPAESMGIRHG